MKLETGSVRAFLACPIDAAAATQLCAALEPLRTIYSGGAFRWIPPANYHVTLRFFGELPPESIAAIDRLIQAIAAAGGPIRCVAAAPQPLPHARSPRVIVLPVASNARLEHLAAQCSAALVGEFGPADKPFKAHVSVVRCGRGARFIESPTEYAFPLTLTHMALFESTSTKGGPRYTPRREYRLGG